MRRRILLAILTIALLLTGCAHTEKPLDLTAPIADHPREIIVVNGLVSSYLEGFKENGEDYPGGKGKILNYSIDAIDVVDGEFKERLKTGKTLSDVAILASVQFTVTPDPTDENSINWAIPAGDIEGNEIHCSSALFIDLVNGEYQIVEMGSGW